MFTRPDRQGDILIIPVDAIPEGLVPVERDSKNRLVLAHGETGHLHAILDDAATLFCQPDLDEMEDRFLLVEREVQFVHVDADRPTDDGKHNPFPIHKGKYIVRHVREYTPRRIARYVCD